MFDTDAALLALPGGDTAPLFVRISDTALRNLLRKSLPKPPYCYNGRIVQIFVNFMASLQCELVLPVGDRRPYAPTSVLATGCLRRIVDRNTMELTRSQHFRSHYHGAQEVSLRRQRGAAKDQFPTYNTGRTNPSSNSCACGVCLPTSREGTRHRQTGSALSATMRTRMVVCPALAEWRLPR